MIPVMRPSLPTASELLPYLQRIDASHWYTNGGPLVHELEHRLEKLYGGHVAVLSSGTSGLELCMMALGWTGAVVPAYTFRATITAARRQCAHVSFADVDPATWLLNSRYRAHNISVCAYGAPIENPDLHELIDAAGAFGNQGLSDAPTVFSLHATKALAAGEGGFLLCRDARLADVVRRLSNFNFGGESSFCGTNAKMSEYHAAVALASLDGWNLRRAQLIQLRKLYHWFLGRYCPTVAFQQTREDIVSMIFPVLLPDGIDLDGVIAKMRVRGVACRSWYECFAYHGEDVRPVAKMLSNRVLGLPFFIGLTLIDGVRRVCKELGKVLSEHA